MDGLKIEPIVEHGDARGVLRKLWPAGVDGEVYSVSIAPGASRGHHAHQRMGEWFIALSPGGVLGVSDGSAVEHHPMDGVRIYVPAGLTHALFNVGDTELLVLALAEGAHDPDDVVRTTVPGP